MMRKFSLCNQILIALLSMLISFGISAVPTSQPTGQPTRIPSSQPTSTPSTAFQARISFNVTLLLREVSTTSFNSNSNCKKAIGTALTDSLNLQDNQGFKFRGAARAYVSNVFGYDYDKVLFNADLAEGTIPPPTRRNLGETKGNVGSAVTLTLYAIPSQLGFSSDASLDDSFSYVRDKLQKLVDRSVMAGIVRDHARSVSCAPAIATSAVELPFISNDYLTQVTHFAAPTSQPTLHPRVRIAKNKTGVIAGCIFGVTAFIMAAMYLTYKKDDVAVALGIASLIEREDTLLESPELIIEDDV